MRGEYKEGSHVRTFAPGLSPRARGIQAGRRLRILVPGSIPACAGNTFEAAVGCLDGGVYPRVRGEYGSSEITGSHMTGLSPRARGILSVHLCCRLRLGSIPACAGNTRTVAGAPEGCWVYPRVRGEYKATRYGTHHLYGLSPRARGIPAGVNQDRSQDRSIPACAGNT